MAKKKAKRQLNVIQEWINLIVFGSTSTNFFWILLNPNHDYSVHSPWHKYQVSYQEFLNSLLSDGEYDLPSYKEYLCSYNYWQIHNSCF
jgi:hypothetical protein